MSEKNLQDLKTDFRDELLLFANEELDNYDLGIQLKRIADSHKIDISYVKKEFNKIKKQEKIIEKTEPNPSMIFSRIGQVKNFLDQQPIFYDNARMWWIWNFEKSKYEMTDITTILSGVRKVGYDTITSKDKAEISEALRQVGRDAIPEPESKTCIQFNDIVVDILTGKHKKASPEKFITNPIPWCLGESEETPILDKLFGEWVVKEGLQDETYIDTLYEVIAYCAMSKQSLQRLFALVGSGSNGKGVYLSIVKKFIGKENCTSTELKQLTTGNFETSALYKKQVCFFGEVDSADMSNTNVLKKLSGEDDIRYEFKGKTAFTDESSTTCLMATNSLPVSPDKSIGFYRRWLVIDFPHQFKAGKDIISTIPNVEFENLAKKIVRISKELLEKGEFTNEGDIDTRMRRYEDRSNPLLRFIEDNCEESFEEDALLIDVCKAFNEYLKEQRLRPMQPKTIKVNLKNEGFEIIRRNFLGNENKKFDHVIGLRFKKKDRKDRKDNNSLLDSLCRVEMKKPVLSVLSVLFDDKTPILEDSDEIS